MSDDRCMHSKETRQPDRLRLRSEWRAGHGDVDLSEGSSLSKWNLIKLCFENQVKTQGGENLLDKRVGGRKN